MDRPTIGIGLSMVVLASILAALGHYDGVLGSTDPEQVLTGETQPGTFRVTVTGTPQDADDAFLSFRHELLVPRPMADEMSDGLYVPVTFQGAREPLAGFLKVTGDMPQPGQPLVVSGVIVAHWPLMKTQAASLSSMPVVFIDASDYHAPILFKR